MSSDVDVRVLAPEGSIVGKAVELLERKLKERAGTGVRRVGENAHNADITLDLRSEIEEEGFVNEGQITDDCSAAFEELRDIYQAHNAERKVAPPTLSV